MDKIEFFAQHGSREKYGIPVVNLDHISDTEYPPQRKAFEMLKVSNLFQFAFIDVLYAIILTEMGKRNYRHFQEQVIQNIKKWVKNNNSGFCNIQ